MTIEKTYSLRRAAALVGIRRETMKRWLAQEAIVLPTVRQGSKVLIRESDIERVVRKRLAKADWSLLRPGRTGQ